jgi:hypothetical protein
MAFKKMKNCMPIDANGEIRGRDSDAKKAQRIEDILFKDMKTIESTKKLALLKDPAYVEKLKKESIARCVEKSKLLQQNKKRTLRMMD